MVYCKMSISIKQLEETQEEFLFVRRSGFIATATIEFLRDNKGRAFIISEIQKDVLKLYKDLQIKTPDLKMIIITNTRVGNILKKVLEKPLTYNIFKKGSYFYYSESKQKGKK